MRIGMGLSLSSIGAAGGAAPFVAPGTPLGFWQPQILANVTNSGGFASQVLNSSGTAGALVQATPTKQPGYGTTTINGLSTLHQAGSRMMTATLVAGLTDYHVLLVVKANSYPAATYNALASFGSFAPCLYVDNTGEPDFYYTTDHKATNIPMAVGTAHLLEFWRSGTSLFMAVDGVSASGAPYASNSTAIANSFAILSSSQAGAEYGDFDLGEIAMYGSALGSTDRNTWLAHSRATWGTP